jgi:hypothetical protein
MAEVERSVSLYIEMQKCPDEASYQKLLAEDDALNLSRGLPRFGSRSLVELRQPFVSGSKDFSQIGKHAHHSWSDDDYDSYEAMITWARECLDWEEERPPLLVRQLVFLRIRRDECLDRVVLATYLGTDDYRIEHPSEGYFTSRGDSIVEWLLAPSLM